MSGSPAPAEPRDVGRSTGPASAVPGDVGRSNGPAPAGPPPGPMSVPRESVPGPLESVPLESVPVESVPPPLDVLLPPLDSVSPPLDAVSPPLDAVSPPLTVNPLPAAALPVGALSPVPPVPLLNLANALTAIRIALVPVFVILLLSSGMSRPGWQVAAALAFIVASLTDYVDGWIARTWHLVTSFGKVADPIADKALTGTALVLLSGYGRLAWWITVVILVREIGVTVLRFWVIRRGVLAASRGGKAKTALQILGISWLVLPFPGALASIGTGIMLAATAVTVATGLDYVLRAVRLRRAVAGARAPDGG